MLVDFFSNVFDPLVCHSQSVGVGRFRWCEFSKQLHPIVSVLFAPWHVFPQKRVDHPEQPFARQAVITINSRDLNFWWGTIGLCTCRDRCNRTRPDRSKLVLTSSAPQPITHLALQLR